MNTVGVVLAAGASRRLRPHSDGLPKTLVPIPSTGRSAGSGPDDSDGTDHLDGVQRADPPGVARPVTPLDVILGNFGRSGVTEVTIVVGYAAEQVRQRLPELERTHGVNLSLIRNDRAETWNNCYSLWCARSLFDRPVLLCNGDTVHHVAVERALLSTSVPAGVVLAVDTGKQLGDEEMKVTWSAEDGVRRIEKGLDPSTAYGEYIGLALLRPTVGESLAAALEATWNRDPSLYYEDGFAELIRRVGPRPTDDPTGGDPSGGPVVDVQPIGPEPWIEIDDHDDLARATDVLREIV